MFNAADWEWSRQYERGTTAFLRRLRGNRGAEFVRQHIGLLCREGRPVLFLASLCGLAGALLMPVGLSLSVPFFAAGFGAVILRCLLIGCPAGHSATDANDERGKGAEAVPNSNQALDVRDSGEQHVDRA